MGRPKKNETLKGRLKSVKLTALGAYVLSLVRKKRIEFDFGRWVSEKLIDEFGSTEEEIEKYMIAENQKRIDELYKKNEKHVENIRKIREQKQGDE